MQQSKQKIRKDFLAKRSQVEPQQARQCAVMAAGNFINNISLAAINIVAVYYPVSHEISTLPLIEELSRLDVILSLPVIIAKDSCLAFYPWGTRDGLMSNAIYPQISEPAQKQDDVTPDLLIVPLVSFDENCNRLGYGGGFYDRTIAGLSSEKKPVTVGYAYESQKSLTLLPHESHDIPLDFVVTEKTVYLRRI